MDFMKLRIGMIGLSEGNGHPFSWSAIINGYNKKLMEECNFSSIPRYLEKQAWPNDQIKNVEVTNIWTQDFSLSKKIALTCNIPNVVDNIENLENGVDAIILARDDAKNHLKHIKYFLNRSMPVYIDKPVALTLDDLDEIYREEQYPGQIFTCSALRYSKDLKLNKEVLKNIGKITEINAFIPNSWEKYSVHIIEPVLNMLEINDIPNQYEIVKNSDQDNSKRTLIVQWKSGIKTTFTTTGKEFTNTFIRICGKQNYYELNFSDTFFSFKSALEDFFYGIKTKTIRSPYSFNRKVINLIQRGS